MAAVNHHVCDETDSTDDRAWGLLNKKLGWTHIGAGTAADDEGWACRAAGRSGEEKTAMRCDQG